MTDLKDGGPAFPQSETLYEDGAELARTAYGGMSLRDWFAGQGIRARWGNGTAMTPEDAAQMAYQLADAMLAEREKRHD